MLGPNEPFTNFKLIYLRDRINNTTTRVDFAWNWEPHHKQYLINNSYNPCISADGRYVAYESEAYLITQSDTNMFSDIFAYDIQKKANMRVSNPNTAGNTDANSHSPSISNDGRYIAFWTYATNIASNDTNNSTDAIVYDIIGNKTTLVSIGTDGKQLRSAGRPSISSDGRYIAFEGEQTYIMQPQQIYIYDRQNNVTRKITANLSRMVRGTTDFDCLRPDISGDGRYVVYLRTPYKDSTYAYDVVLYDVINNTSKIIASGKAANVSNFFACAPSISSDGHYVAFVSDKDDIVAGDTNGQADIFIYFNK
jgi:Tol biopolymer transport system component